MSEIGSFLAVAIFFVGLWTILDYLEAIFGKNVVVVGLLIYIVIFLLLRYV